YVYDKRSRLYQETDPAIAAGTPVSTWTRDDADRLLTMTEPTGAKHEYAYDDLGRTTVSQLDERYTSPQTLQAITVYDDAGMPASVKTPRGNSTSFFYDGLGERTR